jgi:hypothetical protein
MNSKNQGWQSAEDIPARALFKEAHRDSPNDIQTSCEKDVAHQDLPSAKSAM